MDRLDARGQACPIPVIMARKAIQAFGKEGGQLSILVDNDIACQNLEKMAKGMGMAFERKQCGEDYLLTIATGKIAVAEQNENGGGMLVAFSQNKMGENAELGEILVKGFIFALLEQKPLPEKLVFFNSGVKLLIKGANTEKDLDALRQAGVELMACGTCVNYFGIKDELIECEIVNMYDIAVALSNAQRVVNI